jgi:heme oxygenase
MDILTELRAATGPIHARIEALPVCGAMVAGELDRPAYARLLAGLYHANAAFEAGLQAVPAVADVWPAPDGRAAAALRDLRALGAEPGPVPAAVAAWAADLADGHPAAWAGAGYVFEGSRMGSRVLLRALARGFGVEPRPGVGLDYHLPPPGDPAAGWRRVVAALTTLDADTAARAAIVGGAVATFEALYAVHEGCVPAAAIAELVA